MAKHQKRRMSVCVVGTDGAIVGQDGSISSTSRTSAGIFLINRIGGPAWASARTAIFVQPEGVTGLLHQVERVTDSQIRVRLTTDAGVATDAQFAFMLHYLD